MEFTGKTVVITGGGTGIGKAAAAAFWESGANVVLNGRREEVLARAARELDPARKRVAYLAGDIGRPDTGARLVATAVAHFGGVDVLLNNAGIFKPTPFADHTERDFDGYVGTILKGSFFAAQAAAQEMAKRGGGSIVNTGSLWALQAIGATPSSAYSAAKAGVHALTRNLAIELASSNIRVNAVAPAVVDTPVYEAFLAPEQIQPVLASFDAFHPLGRHGQPGDVVGAILFLASPAASWITGVVLPVDGGVAAGHHA